MKTKDEVKAYIEKLYQQGVGRYTAAPPLYRLLWRMGLNIPPPFCQSFRMNVLVFGILFTIFYPIIMWMMNNLFTSWGTSVTVFQTVFTGVVFGLGMAGWIRWKSKKLDIPKW